MLLSTTSYHAGDLSPNYFYGQTPLPGTTDNYGWYAESLLDASGNPLTDPDTGIPNFEMYYEYGFWGYANYVRTAMVPAMNGQPAKIVVADSLTGHLRISRYLFDVAGVSGQIFDPTFNNGQPLIISSTTATDTNNTPNTYLNNRSETLGDVTVDAMGNIYVTGTTYGLSLNALQPRSANPPIADTPANPGDPNATPPVPATPVLPAPDRSQTQPAVQSLNNSALWFDANAILVRLNAADGSIDKTFDAEGKIDQHPNDGVVIYDFANGQEQINTLLTMPSGEVVIGGSTTLDPGQRRGLVLLVEFKRDGSVDNTFGQDGRLAIDAVGADLPDGGLFYPGGSHFNFESDYGNQGWAPRQYDQKVNAMALTADGKILIGGSSNTGQVSNTEFILMRINANGTVDTGFGTNGLTTTDIQAGTNSGGGEDAITDMVVQSDGKIVVSGYSTPGVSGNVGYARRPSTYGVLARYTINGTLDTSFGGTGYIESRPVGDPAETVFNTLLLQSDGKILAGGFSDTSKGYSFLVARFNTDGTSDFQFGTRGATLTRIDTLTQGDYWDSGDYRSETGIPDQLFWAGATSDPLYAQDMIVGMYLSPTTGEIQTVGFSMTTALLQTLGIPGPTVFEQPLYTADWHAGDGQPIPAYSAFGKLEFVRYTNDTPNYQSDTTAPQTLLTVSPIDVNSSTYEFQVLYSDENELLLTSFGGNDVVITGPNGYTANATLVRITRDQAGTLPATSDTTPVYVTYRVTQPTGGWINGVYTLTLNPRTVTDIFGNFAVGGTLGTLAVTNAPDRDTPVATLTSAPNLTVLGGMFYDFTVTYNDLGGINASTIDSNDIRVNGPNGFSQLATLVRVDQQLNGTQRIATYRITAPNGLWLPTDIGSYTIIMQSNQVVDTAYPLGDPRLSNDPDVLTDPKTHFVIGGQLGTFSIIPLDTEIPTAIALAGNVNSPGGTVYQFSVTYSDDIGINIGSLSSNNITVTGPNGFSVQATLVQVTPAGNGTPRVAIYQFTPPGGAWAPTNYGTYTIHLNGNQVYDLSNKFVVAQDLASFRVRDTSDTTLPGAVVVTAPDINILGGATQVFTVRFTDNVAIDVSTIRSGVVTVVGPNGYSQTAILLGIDSGLNGTPRVATFQISAPGGGWNANSVGAYAILLNANTVADVDGNYVNSGQIGSFNITQPDLNRPTAALAAAGITTGSMFYTFSVSYTDDIAINPASIQSGDVVVTGPNGYSQAATLVSIDSNSPGKVRVATYRVAAPNGIAWRTADQGTYTFVLQANRVADMSGNTVLPLALGTALLPDTTPPTAVLTALNITTFTASVYEFTVTYSDASGINTATIVSGNVKVTGPNGYSQVPTLVSTTTLTNGDVVATYRITSPQSTWQPSDGGLYTVFIPQGAPKVKDTLGNMVGSSSQDVTLGTFAVSQNQFSTTTLASSTNPIAIGVPVTFTALVTGSMSTPTGVVTFYDGATALGAGTLSGGAATFTTSDLAIGTHVITAVYSGDVTYGTSTSTLTQAVNVGSPQTANVSLSSSSTTPGSPVTLTMAVLAAPGSDQRAGSPTGSVSFVDVATGSVLGTSQVNAGHVATLIISNLSPGSHTIRGVYSGDANFVTAEAATSVVIGTNSQRYVNQLYMDLFGRTADDTGLTYWSGLLDRGQSTTIVSNALMGSAEYQSNQVRAMYRQYLNRDADDGGLNYMVGLMQAGVSADNIRILLLSSQEFFNRAGGTNEGYVASLYQHVLNRGGDPSGSAYWVGMLNSGLSRNAVATAFVTTGEFRSTFVSSLYSNYLMRPAERSGIDFWTGQLASGMSESALISTFLTTGEYYVRHGLTQ